jgi:FlaA1/EpsC-like NDP-sugar epimerase
MNFKKTFTGKRVLVTGGTGSIGSEIVRQLLKYSPKQIRIYSRDEFKQHQLSNELRRHPLFKNLRFLLGDIRDRERLDRAFNDIDIVFHAAALKHVSFCETNPFEAMKTNVLGTQNVVEMAIDHRIEKMVTISTDKAVNPSTFMGITKLMSERMVVAAPNYSGHPEIKFAVVRFGNVLNSRGSVIPLWMEQIKKGGPVLVTDKNMERFFMTIPDAVHLVFSAASQMLGSEIFVLKMKKYKIYDIAQELVKRYSNGKPIKIKEIGAGEREKSDEFLFTEEEAKTMIDSGPFYIILPNKELHKKRISKYKTNSKKAEKLPDILASLQQHDFSLPH